MTLPQPRASSLRTLTHALYASHQYEAPSVSSFLARMSSADRACKSSGDYAYLKEALRELAVLILNV